MKKGKPSKKKVNPDNSEPKLEEPVRQGDTISSIEALITSLEQSDILSSTIITPFKELEYKDNPFVNSDFRRAKIFSMLVLNIYKFALLCKELISNLKYSDEEQIKRDYELLCSERDRIRELLTKLIAEKAKKTLAHQFIRFCELHPAILISWVNTIVKRLKIHQALVKKDKHWKWKDKEWQRRKAVENFLATELEALYDNCYLLFRTLENYLGIETKPFRKKETLNSISVNTVLQKSYPETAVSILSAITGAGYDRLYGLCHPKNKTKKNQKTIIKYPS